MRPQAGLFVQITRAAAAVAARSMLRTIEAHPAQTTMLGFSAASLAVAAYFGHLNATSVVDVAAQIAAHPAHVSLDTWVLVLVLSSAGRMAACIVACLLIAR